MICARSYQAEGSERSWLIRLGSSRTGPAKLLPSTSDCPLPDLTVEDIKALPVADAADEVCHLYLWVPNALLPLGIEVMRAWGFQYKSNIVWHKIRKDGGF